jgi:putative phage-type endonuclease
MTHDQRREWLAERRTGIGSSDAPNLVGVGFRDAASVYRSKVEEVPDPDPTGFLLRGIELEDLVARKYAERMGTPLALGRLVRHPERAWQFATTDRVRPDGNPVEVKTVVSWADWGDEMTGEVPAGYRVQVTHQGGVAAADFVDVAALNVIDWELRVFRVAFDRDLYDWLTAVEAEFVEKHVVPRVPPAADWEGRWRDEAVKLVVRHGSVIDLGEEAAALLARRKAYADVRREAEAKYDELTERVKALMGDHQKATAGPFRLTRSFVAGRRVEYDREPYVLFRATQAKAVGDGD